jgi:hypothetical protein
MGALICCWISKVHQKAKHAFWETQPMVQFDEDDKVCFEKGYALGFSFVSFVFRRTTL